jgi:hypothetical protein
MTRRCLLLLTGLSVVHDGQHLGWQDNCRGVHKVEILNLSTQPAASCVYGTQRCSQQHRHAAHDPYDAERSGLAPGFRSPGELIHDKLFGQEYFKMILLPSCFVAVLAAASAIIRTL